MSRIDRVNQQLKREIGQIIQQDLRDPRLEFVSITSVDVSRDLRSAKVFFSVLGDEHQAGVAQQGLDSARGIIRKFVAQRIKLRYTPDFIFSYDKTMEQGARIEETLKEINELKKNHSGNQET